MSAVVQSAIANIQRQVGAARSTKPSKEFLAYQMTQRGLERNEIAERFLLVQSEDKARAPFEESLRWYLGDENFERLETVTSIPRHIPKNTRVLIAEPSLADLAKLGTSASRVRIVGPKYYRHVEVWTGCTMGWRDLLSGGERRELRQLGSDRYQDLVRELGGSQSALVFTTGPSIDSVDVESLGTEHDLRIACNSIVSNPKMLDALKPNVFAFGDGAFHFGPSRYAAEFRKDLCEFLEQQSPWVLTSIEMFPLLQREMPAELLERFVPVELSRRAPNEPKDAPLHLRNGNVMTTFMLPAASYLSRNVTLAGCDGRSPDDEGFWSHSSSAQYDDLYQTVIDAHPSFFEDADYVAYYERHCGVLEQEVRRLTETGVNLQMATPSYIPALRALPGGAA